MSTTERASPRHCPDCGARGILPLDQPRNAAGGIDDPVMLCPSCETEFRATGTSYLGASRPPVGPDASEEDLERWARAFAKRMVSAITARSQRTSDEAPEA